jgi:predicted transcriptional regulator YdeE
VSIEEGIEFPVEGVGYEVHIETGTEPRMHYCLTGVEVSALGALPPEVFVKVLPPCTYAVFTHRVVEGYETLYARIKEWLDLTQHERNTDFDFQLYDVRFKGMDDPESLQDVYIPLKS